MASQHSEQVRPPCPGFLRDSTRKLLPGAFVLMFVITGTVVLVYTLSLHQPVPSNFMTGVAITFGVLITLMLIGNFLLYARKQMSLVRSASGSESSIRIQGEREAWHVRLRKALDEYEDRPRRLFREFALRGALKRNSRKRSINTVNQNRELPMIDLSHSEVNHRNPDPTLSGTIPVDYSRQEIDLERGEHPEQQTPSGDLGITILGMAEATTTRNAPNVSIGIKNHAEISHDLENLENGLEGSSKTPRMLTTARSNSLSDTNQGMRQVLSPCAEVKKIPTMRTRKRTLVLPDKQLIEQHSQRSMNQEGYRSSRVPKCYRVDSRIPSEPSEENATYNSTYQMRTEECLSNVQLYRLEIPQQQMQVSHFVYGTSTIGESAITLDQVKPILEDCHDTCHSKLDHITTGFHIIQSSNIPPNSELMEQSNKTTGFGILDNYTSDVPLDNATPTNDSDFFRSSTSACFQITPKFYLSSLELGPQIPAYRGSSASGFTSSFMDSISGIFHSEVDRHEVHPATVMTQLKITHENGVLSEEAHLKAQKGCGAGG